MGKKKNKINISLSLRILIGMLLGLASGLIFKEKIAVIGFLGDIFLRLLRMCIYPMVILSIVGAISNVADISRLKKVGILFIACVLVGSGIASTVGIITSFIIKPGQGMNIPMPAQTEIKAASEGYSFINTIVDWVPSNPFAAISEGNLVQIVIFSLFFGVIFASIRQTEAGTLLSKVIDALNDIITRMVNAVLDLAPIGVFSLMGVMIGTTGFEMIKGVAGFLAAFWLGLLIFMLVIQPLGLIILARVSPIQYYKNIFPVMLLGFTTMSGMGCLPLTMKVSKERLGIPSDIVDLVAPPGVTVNMNGAAIEYPCYVIWAMFMYNQHLSIGQLIFVVALCVMLSVGAAGIPGGGIIMCTICLSVMGFPQDIVGVVAGVYTLLDVGATILNISGNTVSMTIIAALLGELDRETFNAKRLRHI